MTNSLKRETPTGVLEGHHVPRAGHDEGYPNCILSAGLTMLSVSFASDSVGNEIAARHGTSPGHQPRALIRKSGIAVIRKFWCGASAARVHALLRRRVTTLPRAVLLHPAPNGARRASGAQDGFRARRTRGRVAAEHVLQESRPHMSCLHHNWRRHAGVTHRLAHAGCCLGAAATNRRVLMEPSPSRSGLAGPPCRCSSRIVVRLRCVCIGCAGLVVRASVDEHDLRIVGA